MKVSHLYLCSGLCDAAVSIKRPSPERVTTQGPAERHSGFTHFPPVSPVTQWSTVSGLAECCSE